MDSPIIPSNKPFAEDIFPDKFSLPLEIPPAPLFIPGQYDYLKAERSVTSSSSSSTSVVVKDRAEEIRRYIISQLPNITATRSKKGAIDAKTIKGFLDELNVRYDPAKDKKKNLIEKLFSRLDIKQSQF